MTKFESRFVCTNRVLATSFAEQYTLVSMLNASHLFTPLLLPIVVRRSPFHLSAYIHLCSYTWDYFPKSLQQERPNNAFFNDSGCISVVVVLSKALSLSPKIRCTRCFIAIVFALAISKRTHRGAGRGLLRHFHREQVRPPNTIRTVESSVLWQRLIFKEE